ncbi:two pore domain potassium channel family protein [archaeon]|nr:MAG: two pore domain potassium channel family protein [archaeon]
MKENTRAKCNLTHLWQMYQSYSENTKESIRFTGGLFAVFVFFLLAVVFYSNYEGWSINDSVFFTIVTISTVGKASLCPNPFLFLSELFVFFIKVMAPPIQPMTTHVSSPYFSSLWVYSS